MRAHWSRYPGALQGRPVTQELPVVQHVCREAVSFGSANAKFAERRLADRVAPRPESPPWAHVVLCPRHLHGARLRREASAHILPAQRFHGSSSQLYDIPGRTSLAFQHDPRNGRFVTSSCEMEGPRPGKSHLASSGHGCLR